MAKSSSVACPTPGTSARVGASPTRLTPARAAGKRGRKASATAASTSSVSALLHTPGRWVLALTRMASAMARSAAACT